jgi:hypothetical protein
MIRRARVVPSLVACLLLVVTGCGEIHPTIFVTNGTPNQLRFEITLANGQDFPLPIRAEPSQRVPILTGGQLADGAGMTKDACTVGELRALGENDQVVKTWAPPVCATTTLKVP